MDPDGTIYLTLNFIISILTCLYIGVENQINEDCNEIGVSPSTISGFVILMTNLYCLATYSLPRFDFTYQLLFGALFILFATMLPYCVGLANFENLSFIRSIVNPFIMVLNYTITLIIYTLIKVVFKIFKLDTKIAVTEKDVMDLVSDADEEVIDDEQKEMIENIFELNDLTAGNVMTHRTEVFFLQSDLTCKEAIIQSAQEGFSRMPVYEKTVDTILGVLYAKDLLVALGDEDKLNQPIKNYVRPAMFVPESCAANELLIQFKLKRMQLAVVVDEYGGTSGIVTMEDVLEEIVGNIQDEFDDEEDEYTANQDGTITCLASMNIEDLMEVFDIKFTEEMDDEEFDTIGGLIIDRLERIPAQEEQAIVEYEGLIFKVLEVADRKINKVQVAKM